MWRIRLRNAFLFLAKTMVLLPGISRGRSERSAKIGPKTAQK
jgi:hypothetical protein